MKNIIRTLNVGLHRLHWKELISTTATSSVAAQTGAFSLYAVTASPRGAQKAKKLGQGDNPTELEAKFRVAEKMHA